MASAVKKYEYRVPRSFRLRQELEFAEKGATMESKNTAKAKDPHFGYVSFGLGALEDNPPYDLQLANWNGTIIGPQNTVLGERIYNLKIKCGPRYPDVPPMIYFEQKIVMPGVNQSTGAVDHSTIMRTWNRNNTMYDYLVAIRTAMVAAAKTKQPSPNEQYPAPQW